MGLTVGFGAGSADVLFASGPSGRPVRRAAVEAIAPGGGPATMLPLRMAHIACSFEESCRRPFDVRGLLEFFAVRALPGVEKVDPERLVYRRTIDLPAVAAEAGDGAGAAAGQAILRVDFHADRAAGIQVHTADGLAIGPAGRKAVAHRVRRLFDLDADPEAIAAGLGDVGEMASGSLGGVRGLESDGRLAAAGVRMPGAWDRFETVVRAILGQQISVAGARTLAGRLVSALGAELPDALRAPGLERTFPSPAQVAAFDLRTIGLPASRARALCAMAAEVAAGRLRLDADPAEVRERLLAVKGIGPWTVEYVAMRALGERDAFPASDLGLRKAVDPKEPPSAAELEAMAESWRPLRAYAALLLWRRAGGG